jgi:exosortase B
MRGGVALRAFWFPVLFFVFMIPLPGMIVDALTNPLKRHVSEIAEVFLYAAGYPIARSGVTLTIGPYQLLVADACSGMHSLYSLSALGLLYLYLVKHGSLIRNAILALSILPIAFGANIVRVVFLVLVTYYLGDEAGQGFLHGFAGMVLFVAALLMIFLLDALLGVVAGRARAGAVTQ